MVYAKKCSFLMGLLVHFTIHSKQKLRRVYDGALCLQKDFFQNDFEKVGVVLYSEQYGTSQHI